MADYYPLIARAVAGLDNNTGETRRAVYDRARAALLAQLRGAEPRLPDADITRERLALEAAIRKVETEAVRSSHPAPQAPGQPSAPRPAAPSASPLPPRETVKAPPSFASPTAPLPPAGKTPPADAMPDWSAPKKDAPRPAAPVAAQEAPAKEVSVKDTFAKGAPTKGAPTKGTWEKLAAEIKQTETLPGKPDAVPAQATPAHPASGPAPSGPAAPGQALRGQGVPEVPVFSGYPPAEDQDEISPPSPPVQNRGALIRLTALIALLVLIVGGLYWQSGNIADWYRSLSDSSIEQQAEPGAPTATQERPKITDRIKTPAQKDQAALQATPQRVVLYEEDPGDPQGQRFVGSAIWRTENIATAPGQPAEIAVRADVEIPERRMTMSLILRRNTDKTLPASHTVELMFNLPADFPGGGITNVPGILMKQAEQARGTPLAGLAVKVTSGFFLVGLSAVESDMQRNIELLKERGWLDIPIVYANNRRAILAIEKGEPGNNAFEAAFAAWKE